MYSGWLVTGRSFLLSVFMHVVLISLLIIGIDPAPIPKPPPRIDMIKAVSVDKKLVESELQKIKNAEKKAVEEVKKKREREEKKLQDLKKKKLEESKKLKQEQMRLKELEAKREIEEKKKKIVEERRKLEEKKKRHVEQERQRQEEKLKRLEEEKKRRQEELKRLEEEKKRRQEELKRQEKEAQRRKAEELMQKQLLAEEAELEEVQKRQDKVIIDQYVDRIKRLVAREFNTKGLSDGLSCKISIRLIPGGSVAGVQIIESSGNKIFDNRALIAVQKASPLPVPEEFRLFEKMREIRFTFVPGN